MTNANFYKSKEEAQKAYADFFDYFVKHNPENMELPPLLDWLFMEYCVNPKFEPGDIVIEDCDCGHTFVIKKYDDRLHAYRSLSLCALDYQFGTWIKKEIDHSESLIDIKEEPNFKKIGYIDLY